MAADKYTDQPTTPQRYGRGMLVLAWIAIFGLLYVFFGDLVSDFNNPNQNPETSLTADGQTQIVLQRNRYGHYVATGNINGQAVEFLLDTGATSISVTKNIAKRLDLNSGSPIPVHTANGTIIVYKTRLDSVSIGDIHLYDIDANINPHMQGESILLGMSFLKHVNFTQSGKELIITHGTGQ